MPVGSPFDPSSLRNCAPVAICSLRSRPSCPPPFRSRRIPRRRSRKASCTRLWRAPPRKRSFRNCEALREGLFPARYSVGHQRCAQHNRGAVTVQQNTQGYRLKSTDQADLVLIFANGVAASRLSPYLGREHLRGPARTHTVGGVAQNRHTQPSKAGTTQRFDPRCFLGRMKRCRWACLRLQPSKKWPNAANG